MARLKGAHETQIGPCGGKIWDGDPPFFLFAIRMAFVDKTVVTVPLTKITNVSGETWEEESQLRLTGL